MAGAREHLLKQLSGLIRGHRLYGKDMSWIFAIEPVVGDDGGTGAYPNLAYSVLNTFL